MVTVRSISPTGCEDRIMVVDAARLQRGLVLADRQSGKVLAVTLWESEQAMNATEDTSHWLRIFSAESGGGTIESVERYEVLFSAVQEAPISERSGASRSPEAGRTPGTSGRAG